jgi:tRNA(Ile)-lysidine synthase TilS/MesJ
MKICNRCILPATFPNIKFDENGICNHCRREEQALDKNSLRRGEYRQKLDDLIFSIKGKSPTYDAVIAYSGGKDSTYTLKILKEQYHLRILAFTLDNHFVSPTALKNIELVCDHLGVDQISFRPSWPFMKKVFTVTAREDIFSPATLLRASAICTACIGIVKSLVLRTALEESIPLVAFGWSPGQAPMQSAIMRTNPGQVRQNQKVLKAAFSSPPLTDADRYFIPDTYYDIHKEDFPHNIHPLAFFDYDEETIKLEIEGIGWRLPANTDTNSTNCLLNAFANECHLSRHGFHPYVWEIANMVRQGVMSRSDGIEKIYAPQDSAMVQYARDRLGL